MADHHLHATMIEQIGRRAVASHFGLSSQALQNWLKRGVPLRRRLPFSVLATRHGVLLPADFLDDLSHAAEAATPAAPSSSGKESDLAAGQGGAA